MKIENPFESGHIKNYILLYVSVVVIMILFFAASTLFNDDTKKIEKKSFDVNASLEKDSQQKQEVVETSEKKKFKLLKKAY
jgi:amino acid permease